MRLGAGAGLAGTGGGGLRGTTGLAAGATGLAWANSGPAGSEIAAAAIIIDLRRALIGSTNPFILKDNPIPPLLLHAMNRACQ